MFSKNKITIFRDINNYVTHTFHNIIVIFLINIHINIGVKINSSLKFVIITFWFAGKCTK